jgi:hypothetical protein
MTESLVRPSGDGTSSTSAKELARAIDALRASPDGDTSVPASTPRGLAQDEVQRAAVGLKRSTRPGDADGRQKRTV